MSQSKTIIWVVAAIVVIVVVAAAYYYRSYRVAPYGATGSQDNVSAIEKDLNSLNIEGLDSELSDIEKEL